MRDAERQGAVRAGLELQVHVRPRRELRAARVDDHELDAAVERVHQVPGRRGVGVERVGAPDERAASVPQVRARHLPVQQPERHHRGREAGARLGAEVGRAVLQREALDERAHLLGVAAVEDGRLGSALGLDALEVGGDLLERLVPRDRLELAGAARSGAPERRQQPVLVVHVLARRGALGAQRAAVVRVLARALDLDDAAVAHREVETALRRGVADGADRLADLDPRVGAGELGPQPALRCRPRDALPHRRERGDGGRSTGRSTGHPVAGLVAERPHPILWAEPGPVHGRSHGRSTPGPRRARRGRAPAGGTRRPLLLPLEAMRRAAPRPGQAARRPDEPGPPAPPPRARRGGGGAQGQDRRHPGALRHGRLGHLRRRVRPHRQEVRVPAAAGRAARAGLQREARHLLGGPRALVLRVPVQHAGVRRGRPRTRKVWCAATSTCAASATPPSPPSRSRSAAGTWRPATCRTSCAACARSA